MTQRLTTCTFCGTGCGLYLETKGNKVTGAYPSMSHPTSKGKLCVRGWNVYEVASSPDRLTSPLLKKNGRFEEVTWAEATSFIAGRLTEIRAKHGADSIAFLNSPRVSNEEAYLLQKLARSVIGTNNVDHGAGVYINNSINALLDQIGIPASTNSVSELSQSEVIIVDGVDLGKLLPTLGGVVLRAKLLSGAKLIVIGERRQRLAENADYFLQIKPGAETILYGAMAKVIVDRGLMDLTFINERCGGYESFLAKASEFDLLSAAETCGVSAELIEAAAVAYGQAKAASILYSTGAECRTTETIQSIVNLALLTGQIGKVGAGIFAVTAHNNLQGVCDMGMLPDRLPGYRAVGDPAARADIEKIWGGKLPEDIGTAASTFFTGHDEGKIKAVWLCRYDPVSSAFYGDAAGALERCELVVAQHLFLTESAKYADVVLPTTAYGEEQVTFTNTERRIQLAEKVVEPKAGVIPGWQQLVQVANALGANWQYADSAEVMDEIGRAVPFYGGASYGNLSRDYGRQWPCTKDRSFGTGHFTRFAFCDEAPEKKFKFIPVARQPEEITSGGEYPLTLVFGHALYYWHQNVLIKHSETLKREYNILLLDYPDGFVEINTDDAKELSIRDGEKIRLRSAGGKTSIRARVTPEVRSGTVYVPHFVRQVQKEIFGSQENGTQRVPVCVEKETA
jgi:predicted molibdopterin-dependent oxidoreductase YjgC